MRTFQMWGVAGAIILLGACTSLQRERQPEIGCEGPITEFTNRADLETSFGKEHVIDEEIDVGEGETVVGTVIYAEEPSLRIEVVWRDESSMRQVASIRVSEPSEWNVEGLTTALDLHSVERLNGRPFSLYGFDWDYAGTTASWNGGRLDTSGDCRLLARFRPSESRDRDGILSGEELYASDDPRMQALNPRVYELVLMFDTF